MGYQDPADQEGSCFPVYNDQIGRHPAIRVDGPVADLPEASGLEPRAGPPRGRHGAGQQEINYRFNSLQHAGDDLMKYKYVVHETAALRRQGRHLHAEADRRRQRHRACTRHQSLWKDGKPLFYDEKGYAGLSDLARWYIGGLSSTPPPCWPSPTHP